MGKINLTVPEELGPFLDEQAAAHGFADRSAFVADLVNRESDRARLRKMLEAGRDAPDIGTTIDVFLKTLRQEAGQV